MRSIRGLGIIGVWPRGGVVGAGIKVTCNRAHPWPSHTAKAQAGTFSSSHFRPSASRSSRRSRWWVSWFQASPPLIPLVSGITALAACAPKTVCAAQPRACLSLNALCRGALWRLFMRQRLPHTRALPKVWPRLAEQKWVRVFVCRFSPIAGQRFRASVANTGKPIGSGSPWGPSGFHIVIQTDSASAACRAFPARSSPPLWRASPIQLCFTVAP